MEITVKYFGIMADITQKKEEVILIEANENTLNKLKSKLEIKYPKILVTSYSFAINKIIITNCEVVLNDKDTVALLPPFAGG